MKTIFLVSALSLACPVISAELSAVPDKKLNALLGFQSFGLREFPVERVIETTRELDLDYVEIYAGHVGPATPPARIDEVLKLLAAKKVKLSAAFVGNAGPDLKTNRPLFEFARKVGTRVIILNRIDERGIESLNQLCAEFPDIRLCLHNHGPKSQSDTLANVQALLAKLNPNVGACIDTGHVMRSREDPIAWAQALKGRVYGVHLKEYHGHRPLGPGIDLRLKDFLLALVDGGFPDYGALSVEFEGTRDNPFESIALSVNYVRKLIAEINAEQ